MIPPKPPPSQDWGKREDWEPETGGSARRCHFYHSSDLPACVMKADWIRKDWRNREDDWWLCDTHFQEVFGRTCKDGGRECSFRGDFCQFCGKSATAVTGKLKPWFKKYGIFGDGKCSSCGNKQDYSAPWFYKEGRDTTVGYCESCATYQESDFEKVNAVDTIYCCYKCPGIGGHPEAYKLRGERIYFCQKHYQELVGIKEGEFMRARKDPLYFAQQYLCYDEFDTWDKEKVESAIKELTPSREKGIMSNLVKKVKNLTKSKEDKLLEKYNVTDDCGNLITDPYSSASSLVLQKAFEAHKDEIVEDLKKIQAEEDKKSK